MLARKPSAHAPKKDGRKAKPVGGDADLAALRRDLKAKFPKTIARLAK